MLASLTIQNVVLVDRLTVSFGPGLCALTGETGAGKSVLLDSIGLALGGRAEAGLVRRGADQAAVSAEFELPDDHPVFAFLSDQGIVAESPLILRRVVSADGRSRGWIGDHPVSAGLLRAAGAFLIEIHGQFETQGLLDSRTHRALLDSAGKISS
ncbi:MAG TPA: AAA family ATPase, partial [Alphaproteobacteria bacterium]|nr:AAA family ATPase [Alphaproteobacteria bacterium]